MNVLVVFSHGKETGPEGKKITQLREVAHHAGGQTISVDYISAIDLSERIQILLNTKLPVHP